MVKQLLEQVKQTLANLESAFRKHRNLGNASRSGMKRGWDKIQWSIDAKDIDGLRNKVLHFRPCLVLLAAYSYKLCYQNGVFNLLLTCVGK
jgi:hypothetical protein